MHNNPKSHPTPHDTADFEPGQVQRWLSGWHCSTPSCAVCCVTVSFQLFADIILSYEFPKQHKPTSPPTDCSTGWSQTRGELSGWQEKGFLQDSQEI